MEICCRSHKTLPDAPKYSHMFPNAPKNACRCYRILPNAHFNALDAYSHTHTCHTYGLLLQEIKYAPDAPKCSQMLQGAPKMLTETSAAVAAADAAAAAAAATAARTP
jgi:hypothetical protein